VQPRGCGGKTFSIGLQCVTADHHQSDIMPVGRARSPNAGNGSSRQRTCKLDGECLCCSSRSIFVGGHPFEKEYPCLP
jgi:hypothetical protein